MQQCPPPRVTLHSKDVMGSRGPPANVASRQLNILLVGPRRTGKSSAGNTLLGQGTFFETRGGGVSAAASATVAGHHVSVVDSQGWGSSEEFVPQEERTELLRAVSLCGLGGPHVVLLVIPLLDFTEAERRAVERRMELLTSTAWTHTMVLFTCGDRLKARGLSAEEHIESGGPALRWLMEKCRRRYHVFDNKAAVVGERERRQREVRGGGKKQGGIWQKNRTGGGEADGRNGGEREQVRELLGKVEDTLRENGGWHFSLPMYQRLEEEWSRRERELRARLEAEAKINTEPEQEQRSGTEQGEREDSPRKERENKEECAARKMNGGEDEGERVKVELQRLSSEEDGWETSSGSGGESDDSADVKTGMTTARWPNVGQKLAFGPIRGLA